MTNEVITNEQQKAAALLVATLTPKEAQALFAQAANKLLASNEATKQHPLSSFKLTDVEWKDFKAHCVDGGGVMDDFDLQTEILEALFADDQVTFWPSLVHLFKAWMKIKGRVQAHPDGISVSHAQIMKHEWKPTPVPGTVTG